MREKEHSINQCGIDFTHKKLHPPALQHPWQKRTTWTSAMIITVLLFLSLSLFSLTFSLSLSQFIVIFIADNGVGVVAQDKAADSLVRSQ